MKKQLVFTIVALAWQGTALACEPGTAAFEDTFFKYCDDARMQAQASLIIVPAATRTMRSSDEVLPPMLEETRQERMVIDAGGRYPEESLLPARLP